MEIKDMNDKCLLKVDLDRNIVYEKPTGYWKPEEVERLCQVYARKIVPLFNGKKWGKICDLSNYTMSMVTEEIKEFARWGYQNGYTTVAVVLDENDSYRSVKELQMKIGIKNIPFKLEFFTDVKKADEWLKAQGF